MALWHLNVESILGIEGAIIFTQLEAAGSYDPEASPVGIADLEHLAH